MDKISLKAEKRNVTGKKVSRLRKDGVLPANIYGRGVKSTSIQISLSNFNEVYKEAGETGIVEIKLDKETRPCLIHNIQLGPVNEKPLHVDFYQVDLKQKVTAKVPLILMGESPAEKQGVGVLVQQVDEVEVEALPADLPEKFEVGVENLSDVGQSILLKDVKVSEKVKINDDLEKIVVKIEPLTKEEEIVKPVAETVVEGETPEVVQERGAAEGATPAENVETPKAKE